jgi:hypothetical protein
MNYSQLNDVLSQTIANDGNLRELRKSWGNHLAKVSKFIEMFLDKYGDRIMGDKDNTPEWNLYSKKTEEYNTYARAIRNVEYFIAKDNVSKL